MHPALQHIDHRPWPLPDRPWIMRMSWVDLLFAHWPVPADVLRSYIPRSLDIDTFDGQAWLGLVPFRMEDVAPRAVPALRGISVFPELNVRTYVVAEDRPGVWFFSLDAASRLAVFGARTFFHLPYHFAEMRCARDGEAIRYSSVRRDSRSPQGAHFDAFYQPEGEVFHAVRGSFEHWLTERYCLYCVGSANRLYRGHVHHRPWPLQRARCSIERNTMSELTSGTPAALHFSRRIDVVAWGLESVPSRKK